MNFVDRSFVNYIYIYIYGESNEAGQRTKLIDMVFTCQRTLDLLLPVVGKAC